ncbi:hypothetical protein V6N13_134264 [Hibiscus sabdariffa]
MTGKVTGKVSQATTVFVHNLPEKMHWKGLWATFAHHGDVMDTFILVKRSRSRKRFGFVRFASQADADRAILRLNGFILFGYRVSVSRAKFGSRTSYWRKVTTNWDRSGQRQRPSQFPASPMAARNVNNNINNKSTRLAEKLSREASLLTSNFRDRERIKGYVDEETLWKLQKSLIGYT